MAINQVNSYGASGTGNDIENLQDTVDDQRISYFGISLTEWNTTTIPQIAAGSKLENNGALWEVTTNTTITGSPSDGKVFIYFNPTTPAFVFTNTVPTWSDSKQGWYGTGGSANYRYLPFATTKSGSSYSDKRVMVVNHQTDRTTLEDGTDSDRELFWASDASILWDESEDEFVSSKSLNLTGTIEASSNISSTGGYLSADLGRQITQKEDFSTSQTQDNVYDSLSPNLPDGIEVIATGEYGTGTILSVKKELSVITVYYVGGAPSVISSVTFTNGTGTTIPQTLVICF